MAQTAGRETEIVCLCEVRDTVCVRARVCVVSVCVGMSCQLPQSVSFLQ